MKLSAIVLILTLAGASSAQNPSQVAAATAACGLPADKFDSKTVSTPGQPASPPPGQALVYVIEEQVKVCAFGCHLTLRVGLDGTWQGATQGDSYLSFPVAEGEHHLCSNWQRATGKFIDQVRLTGFTAEPGKVYFFRAHIRPATPDTSEGYSFEQINADEGKLLVARFPLSESRRK